jgi:homoserine acetyltransferase
MAQLGDLILESGEVIKDFRMSYVTHGTLNAAKDNAILSLETGGCWQRSTTSPAPTSTSTSTSCGGAVRALSRATERRPR